MCKDNIILKNLEIQNLKISKKILTSKKLIHKSKNSI